MRDRLVIIGAGQAAAQLLVSLRGGGSRHHITLVGDEPHLPYQRPPLSKTFFDCDYEWERLRLRGESFYQTAGTDLRLGLRAVSIDRASASVRLADGTVLHYDRLVIATGARAKVLDVPGRDFANVRNLRTFDDAKQLASHIRPGRRMVLIGGGYIGLELAASARRVGMDVTVLEAGACLLSRVASRQIAQAIADLHRAEGVDVRTSARVVELRGRTRAEVVVLEDGTELAADVVVCGIGAEPNAELAQACGLDVADGIVVDLHGRTRDPQVFAAGDCTCCFDERQQRHIRFESVPRAIEQAASIAHLLCGRQPPVPRPPWFWSDQYGTRLQMVGLQAGHDSLVARADGGGKLIEFYLQNGKLVAAAAVNCPADFAVLRWALADGPVHVDIGRLADSGVPLAWAFKGARHDSQP